MGNLTIAMTLMLSLTVFMWLSQVAVLELNPAGTEYFHCKGTILEEYDKNKCNGNPEISDSSLSSDLPTSEGDVSPTTGNVFTDVFSSVKSWLLKVPGVKYLIAMLKAPYNILKSIGAPSQIVFGLGTIWYGITFFLVINFMWGKGE